jgi:hypothetical protein
MFRENYGLYPNVTIDLEKCVVSESKELDAERLNGYTAIVTTYKCNDPEKRYWNIMQVQVKDKNGKVCAEFERNYHSVDGIVVTQNGTDYFISSSNYQCITICNLKTGEVKSYTDVDDIQHGCGFCPIYFDWDDGTLYVEGCIWAFPYETMKCSNIDLENPIPAFNTAEWMDDDGKVYTDKENADE